MDIATDSRLVTRLEIVDTGRRRRWPAEEKRRIVEESYSAPRQASATARRHGISNQLLFAWRKAHREGGLGDGSPCDFVPAMLVPENKGPEPVGVRISQKRDSGFANWRTAISLNRGQRCDAGF